MKARVCVRTSMRVCVIALHSSFSRWSNVSNLSEDENEATFQKMLFALCKLFNCLTILLARNSNHPQQATPLCCVQRSM